MITIHATKKLHTKLPLNDQGLIVSKDTDSQPESNRITINPLSGWHANLITLQRRNCILLVHDATRFPLFMKGLVKADFARFNWLFEDTLMNTLLKVNASQQQLDAAAELLAPCQFDTDCNRSVQGTMNQMKGDLEYRLWYDNAKLEDYSSYRTGAWRADRPCTVKGIKDCIWPIKAMLELLSRFPTTTPTIEHADNVLDMAKYRSDLKK